MSKFRFYFEYRDRRDGKLYEMQAEATAKTERAAKFIATDKAKFALNDGNAFEIRCYGVVKVNEHGVGGTLKRYEK